MPNGDTPWRVAVEIDEGDIMEEVQKQCGREPTQRELNRIMGAIGRSDVISQLVRDTVKAIIPE